MTRMGDSGDPVINRDGNAHHCFGCGTLNAIGLQLEFRRSSDGVWAEFTTDRRYEGYAGMVHGGVLSTMLDEAMSWAITADSEFAVTARMNTSFRNPARVGVPLRVEAAVEQRRRRIIDTVATIVDIETGIVIAEAEGRFMRVSQAQAEEWRDLYGTAESP
ncbi:MAG: PaaI family thioesterase [Thermomicrobiales bacterium]